MPAPPRSPRPAIANQEARCADAIVRLFAGGRTRTGAGDQLGLLPTITMSQASWLTAVFQYDSQPCDGAGGRRGGASPGWNGDHFNQMGTWFKALMADTFA